MDARNKRWLEDSGKEDEKNKIFHPTGAAGNGTTTRGAETDSFPELPGGQRTSE